MEHVETPTARPYYAEPHVVVYRVATGERIVRWPIDAKELVSGGEWSFDPPAAREATHESASEPIQDNPTAPVAEIAPAAEYKRGPGRPRKSAA